MNSCALSDYGLHRVPSLALLSLLLSYSAPLISGDECCPAKMGEEIEHPITMQPSDPDLLESIYLYCGNGHMFVWWNVTNLEPETSSKICDNWDPQECCPSKENNGMAPKKCVAQLGYNSNYAKITLSEDCDSVGAGSVASGLLSMLNAPQHMWPTEFELGMEWDDVWLDTNNPIYCGSEGVTGPPPENIPMIEAQGCTIVEKFRIKNTLRISAEISNEAYYLCVYGWDLGSEVVIADVTSPVCPGSGVHTGLGLVDTITCDEEIRSGNCP